MHRLDVFVYFLYSNKRVKFCFNSQFFSSRHLESFFDANKNSSVDHRYCVNDELVINRIEKLLKTTITQLMKFLKLFGGGG